MDDLIARTIRLTGADGAPIEAYLASPLHDEPRGGVVVLHHLPGYDRDTRQATRRLAELGFDALCPNLYSREGIGVDPDDAAAAVRARGGLPDQQLIDDIGWAVAHLRTLPPANGRVGVIGFCSGGRQAVLVGCTVDVDAVIDCYGAAVTAPLPAEYKLTALPITDRLPELRAPVLGLFGNADRNPDPADVTELERILTGHAKRFEFHRYDGAGHAFLATDRVSYRPEAAVDAWERIATFLGTHLTVPDGGS